MSEAADPILRVSNIETYYGPIQAIRSVSLDVPRGRIVTVLGANGAGKTTILRTVSGLMDPERGNVSFEGKDIAHMAPDLVMRRGMCHVPEGREIFPFLTVQENLMMGAYTRRDSDGIAKDMEVCFGYFPVLRERASQRAGLLSGGEQQMLAISRALMGRPKLLLLDEPSLGLSPILVTQIFEHHSPHQSGAGRFHPAGRAERAYRAEDGRLWLHPRGRPHRPAGRVQGAAGTGGHQGILSRPEGCGRSRRAAVEEEEAVAAETKSSNRWRISQRRFLRWSLRRSKRMAPETIIRKKDRGIWKTTTLERSRQDHPRRSRWR